MDFFTQLFGNVTQMWVNVSFIVCVFAVVTFKPENIRSLSLFRLGCILFALSMVAPSMGLLFANGGSDSAAELTSNPFGNMSTSIKLIHLVTPLLFAGAFLSTIISLTPPTTADEQSRFAKALRQSANE